jgi:hypothetical protein
MIAARMIDAAHHWAACDYEEAFDLLEEVVGLFEADRVFAADNLPEVRHLVEGIANFVLARKSERANQLFQRADLFWCKLLAERAKPAVLH